MKTIYKHLPVLAALLTSSATLHAQRYLTEVFNSVTITNNVVYAQNYSFLVDPNNPMLIPLTMDVYEPAGDSYSARPLIIMTHTGSYLPACINDLPTGSRNDSATVEMCNQFARRGFVVANIEYRLGWNPVASNLDVRRGTLFQAVYRSIQDAKCAVRYFRADFANANTFKIDTSMIILGGQGTGGYIALCYNSLDKPSELTIPKFISGSNDPFYGFVAGEPYINQNLLGDMDGYGGVSQLNYPLNTPGYSGEIDFVFNLGGALGDSTWIEPGDKPTVSFHVVGDPFAPYTTGIVYVPSNPPQTVVDVVGSGLVSQLANQMGNNCFVFNLGTPTDPYALAANLHNNGNEGLFPFITNPMVQSGPWEWWDSVTVVNSCGLTAHQNAMLTNPDMSKTKAMAYIDTVMNYLCPRIVAAYPCVTGFNEHQDISVKMFPNPTSGIVNLTWNSNETVRSEIRLYNAQGQQVDYFSLLNNLSMQLDLSGRKRGLYFLKIVLGNSVYNGKIMVTD